MVHGCEAFCATFNDSNGIMKTLYNQNLTPLPHVYPLDSLPRDEAVSLTHEIIARCNYYFSQYLEESLEEDHYEVNLEKTYDHNCKGLVTQLKVTVQFDSDTTGNHGFELVF